MTYLEVVRSQVDVISSWLSNSMDRGASNGELTAGEIQAQFDLAWRQHSGVWSSSQVRVDHELSRRHCRSHDDDQAREGSMHGQDRSFL